MAAIDGDVWEWGGGWGGEGEGEGEAGEDGELVLGLMYG